MKLTLLRLTAILGGLAAFRLSLLVEPLYRARPQTLVEDMSLLVPPGIALSISSVAALFFLLWIGESSLYMKFMGLAWKVVFAENLRTYAPLMLLIGFALLLLPGLPVTMAGWWLLLDARAWLLTLAVAGVIYRKLLFLDTNAPGFVARWRSLLSLVPRRKTTLVFGLSFLLLLVLLTPERRFAQSYDERWGTGDEPRYIRITASLLHDGDADISNAAELVGKRAEPVRFATHVGSWIPAALATAGDVVSSFLGEAPGGEPRPLGGQVIEGRDGGTYYVYLPGFPLLLVPAMALDSFLNPGGLYLTLLACLGIGVGTTILIARLAEPYVGSRLRSYVLSLCVGLTVPLFLHHFQVYPEVTAAACLSVMLLVLLAPRLRASNTIAFAFAGCLLPWLHTKYYPIWGVGMLAFIWIVWRDKAGWRHYVLGLGLPLVACGLQGLYLFHITGSILPDALWILSGYPRESSVVNSATPLGLYHLFLGRWQGLLVYGPLYILAIPGIFELRRRSPYAFVLTLSFVTPYLLIAASHDMGGTGGWIPPARYMVCLIPVLGIWLAAWVGKAESRFLRWIALFMVAAGSFWIAYGMLAEPNFVYDRQAFLASGVVDPSPALSNVLESQPLARRIAYPMLLATGLLLVGWWERRKSVAPLKLAMALFALILAVGAMTTVWSRPEDWIRTKGPREVVRLRPGRGVHLWLPECARGPQLRFEGTGGPHRVTVRGFGLDRELHLPSSGSMEIDVTVTPTLRITGDGLRELRWVELRLGEGQQPLEVERRCR